jgi:hypothetical protein
LKKSFIELGFGLMDQHNIFHFILNLKNDFGAGSTGVQYSPVSSKVEGLCPVSAASSGREKVVILLNFNIYISFLTQ